MPIYEKGAWGREPPTSKTGDFRSGGNLPFFASVATDALLATLVPIPTIVVELWLAMCYTLTEVYPQL